MKNKTRSIFIIILCVLMILPHSATVCIGEAETVESIGLSLVYLNTGTENVYLYPAGMTYSEVLDEVSENEFAGALYTAALTDREASQGVSTCTYNFNDIAFGDYCLVAGYEHLNGYAVSRVLEVSVNSSTNSFGEIRAMYGDTNTDNKINLADVATLLKHTARWENLKIDLEMADVNHDGKVDLLDASKLMKYCAGWDLPVVG